MTGAPTERQIILAWLRDRAAQTRIGFTRVVGALAHAHTVTRREEIVIWLRRRLDRIRPESGLYQAVCEAIAGITRNDHGEAFRCGDLDDLLFTPAERRRMEVP